MSVEPTQREALVRLAASTAEAVVQALERFAPGEVSPGEVSVVQAAEAFAGVVPGTVAAGVSYVDGVTGANVLLASPASARALATRMGATAPEDGSAPLDELELSAVSEACNQMMAAAAGAIGLLLGQEIEISPPLSQVVDGPAAAEELFGSAPYATTTTFHIREHPYRLVLLVPSAFVVRVTRALEELGSAALGNAHPGASIALHDALHDIKLRVWAELGRTRLALADTLALPLGAVVELDRAPDAPVDLYVNGLHFGAGRLLVADDGRWTIELSELFGDRAPAPSDPPSTQRSI